MFKGDISKIGKIAASLRGLQSIPSRAASDVVDGINKLLASQFDNGSDPYGQNWKALKASTLRKQPRLGGPLMYTGYGARHTLAVPKPGAGVSIFLYDYLGFHQTGFRRTPARRVLPYRGFPKAWRKVVDDSVRKAFAASVRAA